MSDHTEGRVVTFYSYKGGTGRTMALANVAWILAANGKRVLVIDWDLESPGLHRFFHPFLSPSAVDTMDGVIDLLRKFSSGLTETTSRPEDWHVEYAKVRQYAVSLDWGHFNDGGGIDFITAGRQDDTYAPSVANLDWDHFYSVGGGHFFNALRRNMKANYDYVLIDSRTGVSDVADICTTHLPDVVVDCFTLSEQGISGAHERAKHIRNRRHPIRILPVPMRVDAAEQERANVGRTVAMQRFAGLPAGMGDSERTAYWRDVEVPYQAYYAYEEILAVFGDLPQQQSSLSAAYERLTRYITDGEVFRLPDQPEALRESTKALFVRRSGVAPEERVVLRYDPEDQTWAEWITEILNGAGVIVYENSTSPPVGSLDVRELVVVSRGRSLQTAGKYPAEPTSRRPPLAIYVANVRPLPAFPLSASASLHDVGEEEAAERLLGLIGHAATGKPAVSMRFPGIRQEIFNVPARNPNFTGRAEDLRALRKVLAESETAALFEGAEPVALRGWGGIGKTQLAVEYAHRFRNAYDVVWWVECDPPMFMDVLVADLAEKIGVTTLANVPDTMRAVLAALGRGEPYRRWLLIFDNAESFEQVKPFMPKGNGFGRVLITSREQVWPEEVRSMAVDVFDRQESISHLQQQVEGLKAEDAARVARALGDLPIAVSTAGAYLRLTGTPVAEYLQIIAAEGPRHFSIEKTWDLALNKLQEQSKGAYRMLQLCSVMAPETGLPLIYSDEMAATLKPFEPSAADRQVRGSLVQHINRLGLLKLDRSKDQIQVHRMLSHVIRERMTEEEREAARHEVHIVLARFRPAQDVDDPSSWPRFRMLWPHLEVSGAASCPEEAVRALMIDRVRYLWQRGSLDQAESLAREVEAGWIGLRQTVSGETERLVLDRQILHLRFNLGNVLRDQARFDDAYRLNESVLREQAERLGENDAHTLMTANGVAADLRALGRYKESLKRDRETHRHWLEHFGEDYPRTLNAMNNLAASHRLMGDYRTARELDTQVYERQRSIPGSEQNPITLRAAANLGRDLREAGEYQESIGLLRATAAHTAKAFGEDSRFALSSKSNLAASLRSAGQARQAAALLETAYERFNESVTVGPTSPELLACRLSWSLTLLALGDVGAARRELTAVRATYEENLGPTHPHSLVCLTNLAAIERAAGDLELARSLAFAAKAKIEETLGADHPYALAAATNLGIVMAEEGKLDSAAALLRHVLTRMRDVLGPDHPDTVRAEANLALATRPANAAVVGEDRILARLAARLGPEHGAVEAFRQHRFLHRVIDPHPF